MLNIPSQNLTPHIEKFKKQTKKNNKQKVQSHSSKTWNAGLFGSNCLTCQDLIHWEWQMSAFGTVIGPQQVAVSLLPGGRGRHTLHYDK